MTKNKTSPPLVICTSQVCAKSSSPWYRLGQPRSPNCCHLLRLLLPSCRILRVKRQVKLGRKARGFGATFGLLYMRHQYTGGDSMIIQANSKRTDSSRHVLCRGFAVQRSRRDPNLGCKNLLWYSI